MNLRSPTGISRLLAARGVGPKTAIKLAERYDSIEELIAASPEERRAVAGSRAVDGDFAGSEPLPEEMLIGAVSLWDDEYPAALRALDDPPPLVWIRGSVAAVQALAGAVVGTRDPSEFGRRTSAAASEMLAEQGAVVVSGLALGIDAVAHEVALARGSRTVAVLGSGLDRPTPREHERLAERIIEGGGALVSEVPPGTGVSPGTLIARNRIQSGLSRLVVVAQCGMPSGTLHTARFALVQRRRLIVPQPRGSHTEHPASTGNLALAATPADPSTVQATGKDADILRKRPRLADDTPADGEELAQAIAHALREPPTPTDEPKQPSLL